MHSFLDRLRTLPAGRRAKWAVLVVWLALAGGLGSLSGQLNGLASNDQSTFLPKSSESTQVVNDLKAHFPGGRELPALIVYQDPAGLSSADLAVIARDAKALTERHIEGVGQVVPPLGPQAKALGLVSKDGTTAMTIAPVSVTDIEKLVPVIDAVKSVVHSGDRAGLQTYVSGAAGISVDFAGAFKSIDGTLLIGTTLLILVLLLVIYRSPVIALVPLILVGIAYSIAAGVVVLLIKAFDLTVNGQTTGILIVLMFGAGTDYCLLITSRYREELRRHEEKHEAMAEALRHTSPAILSSGATVVVAMLVLLVANLESLRISGPVLALGVGTTMLSGLTLLPATLAILGRRAFWPLIPRPTDGEPRGARVWHRIGAVVRRRAPWILAATLVLLGAAVAGNVQKMPSLSLADQVRGGSEATSGIHALSRALPPGAIAPTDVLVHASGTTDLAGALGAVTSTLDMQPGIAQVGPPVVSSDGQWAHISVTLSTDPYTDAAITAIPSLRQAVAAAGSANGAAVLVGGPTAVQYDIGDTVNRDVHLIYPLTIAAILVILMLLLRSLVAPLYLAASVVLSFAATIGLSTVLFLHVFNAPGSDSSIPVYVFLFVVALGVDYNIFLMARIREESHRGEDARLGVLRGLEHTGGVITSAGVILAGTFCVLMVLPLEILFQVGFAVALGVALDTFIVRSLLVPSLAMLLGRASWWPSRLGRIEPAAQQPEQPAA